MFDDSIGDGAGDGDGDGTYVDNHKVVSFNDSNGYWCYTNSMMAYHLDHHHEYDLVLKNDCDQTNNGEFDEIFDGILLGPNLGIINELMMVKS